MNLKPLIRKHDLDRVEIVANLQGFHARAYPSAYGAVVQARRMKALESKTDWSITEAGRVTQEAAKEPLARASGKTLEEAVAALAAALKTPSGAP